MKVNKKNLSLKNGPDGSLPAQGVAKIMVLIYFDFLRGVGGIENIQ